MVLEFIIANYITVYGLDDVMWHLFIENMWGDLCEGCESSSFRFAIFKNQTYLCDIYMKKKTAGTFGVVRGLTTRPIPMSKVYQKWL